MQNDKLRAIRDFIVKRGKFLFPVVIVAAAAVTVTVALNVGRGTPAEIVQTEQETASVFETAAQETQEQTVPEVPLVANEDSDIYSLVATYYNAVALGDTDTILSICDEMSDTD